ncbi:UBA domain-containing protein [Durusdinium trenchii]|uniref:UBA domain-containing protein n=1 Tax=Durusdinium trenchii TaxID=1381693 RepID=A0ABP0NFE4_9DINO
MLKEWIRNPNLADMVVEERYTSWVESLRTDRYVTVSELQLEKIYGTSKEALAFIAEVLRGQTGVPHPQAPSIKKARLYKVLKEIIEDTSKGQRGASEVSLSGRVKDGAAKALLQKQLGGLGANIGEFMDLKTGAIKAKKPKKEKPPEQEAIAELKKVEKKWKDLLNGLEKVISELAEYKVRNASELVDPAAILLLIEAEKELIQPIDTDVKDGKRRVSLEDLQYWVPLVVHGDDAEAHRRRSFCVVTLASAVCYGSQFNTRYLLYAIDNAQACQESYMTLDMWLMWSLIELQEGRYMSVDPWQNPITRPQGPVAGPYKGVLVNLKGDEKFLQRTLRLQTSWVSENVCALCRASKSGPMVYTTFGVNAPHRTTKLDTSEFIMEAVKPNPWVMLPGFHIDLINFDWLHVVDLTLAPECAASALELTQTDEIWPGDTPDERLRLAYVDFVRECKIHGVRNRGEIFSLLL